MRRFLKVTLAMAAAIYVAICAALFLFQRQLIYLPPKALHSQDSIETLHVDGADLLVSVMTRPGPKAIVYFGGNAEDVSFTLGSFAETFPDHSLYLLHYRGYCGSTGTPSEAANRLDSVALFERALRGHSEVAIVGRSLGTGVAVQLASLRPASRLVLITPFDSLEEIAARQFPLFPVRLLLRDKYDSARYAPGIRSPTTILVAENDEIIPRARSQRLFEQFADGVAVMKVLPGVGHNSISARPDYFTALRAAL
jgi:pimeloyl-ACP methyl ester carboxylesterase